MTKAKRHKAPWTAADLKRLKACARSGLSTRQAAEKLGRTTGALKYKAMVAGIRFHKIEQPRGVQKRLAESRRRASRARSRAARKAAIARHVKPAGVVRLVSAVYS